MLNFLNSLVIGLVAAALVYTTSLFREDTELPFYYYGLLIILNGLAQVRVQQQRSSFFAFVGPEKCQKRAYFFL